MRAPMISRKPTAFWRFLSSWPWENLPRVLSVRCSRSAGTKYGWYIFSVEAARFVGDWARECPPSTGSMIKWWSKELSSIIDQQTLNATPTIPSSLVTHIISTCANRNPTQAQWHHCFRISHLVYDPVTETRRAGRIHCSLFALFSSIFHF